MRWHRVTNSCYEGSEGSGSEATSPGRPSALTDFGTYQGVTFSGVGYRALYVDYVQGEDASATSSTCSSMDRSSASAHGSETDRQSIIPGGVGGYSQQQLGRAARVMP